MAGSMPSNPADLRWSLSYDRVSVDRFLAEIEVQRGALQAQIERAVQAREVAEAAAARRHAAGRTDLGEQVVAAWGELDRLEAEHREIVTTIREAAEREATRVLAAAHREVAAMRESTATLAALVHPIDTVDIEETSDGDDTTGFDDVAPIPVDRSEARDHADAG